MGAELDRLVQVMDELRRNCPWDKEQTHRTLLTYLVEETYELVDAIESDDVDAMREELGDLLLQVIFHSRIAEEEGNFTIEEVARGISDKLISRHPHVFGEVELHSADEVERNWEALKAKEKGRTSVVDGIPLSQPALAWTWALLGRARIAPERFQAGVTVPEAVTEESIGELLLAVVSLAQTAGIDPEVALRAAGRRLITEIQAGEADR